MKNIILILIAVLSLTSCAMGGDDPQIQADITGVWEEQYPEGLQTEGFVEWVFSKDGKLDIRIYDVFAGDTQLQYQYELWIEGNSVNVFGYVDNGEQGNERISFASFDIARLTNEELHLKCVWYNDDPAYLQQTAPFRYDSSIPLTFRRRK